MCAFCGFHKAIGGENFVVLGKFDAGLQTEFGKAEPAGHCFGLHEQCFARTCVAVAGGNGKFADVKRIGLLCQKATCDGGLARLDGENGFVFYVFDHTGCCQLVQRRRRIDAAVHIGEAVL